MRTSRKPGAPFRGWVAIGLVGSAVAATGAWCTARSAAIADAPINVTIYSSLPLDSFDEQQTRDVIAGQKIALGEVNSRIGDCTVTYKSLDDSTEKIQHWDPARTADNARTAAQDSSTVAYIGDFNSSASSISIPILNQAGIAQISPSNTALSLTKDPGPKGHGAPGKYYPSGKRTYARVIAADHIQAGALAEWMKELRVKRLYITAANSGDYGPGIARVVAAAAKLNGIRVLANAPISPGAPNSRDLAKKVHAARADAFFFGGITNDGAVRLYRDVFAASPKIKLFGSEGVAETPFTSKLTSAAQRRMHITVGTIDPRDYPAAAQQFFKAFRSAHGGREPEPYAIYGYEAMSLALDAMRRAGSACGDRAAVLDQLFKTSGRQSVLGTYSIDADGDTTANLFGRFLVKRGRLVYDRTVRVKRDSYGRTLGR